MCIEYETGKLTRGSIFKRLDRTILFDCVLGMEYVLPFQFAFHHRNRYTTYAFNLLKGHSHVLLSTAPVGGMQSFPSYPKACPGKIQGGRHSHMGIDSLTSDNVC